MLTQVECGFHGDADGSDLLAETGPVLQITISFQLPGGMVQTMSTQALIDTGAKSTHIDMNIAKALKLPVVDRRGVAGSNGRHVVDVYLARLDIPALNETMYGQFAGVRLIEGGSSHGALIGRNLLRKMRMTYDGASGRVTLIKP